MVAARLQGHVKRTAASLFFRCLDCFHFRVWTSKARVPSLAHQTPVTHDNGTRQWIGFDAAATLFRQGQGPVHPGGIQIAHEIVELTRA